MQFAFDRNVTLWCWVYKWKVIKDFLYSTNDGFWQFSFSSFVYDLLALDKKKMWLRYNLVLLYAYVYNCCCHIIYLLIYLFIFSFLYLFQEMRGNYSIQSIVLPKYSDHHVLLKHVKCEANYSSNIIFTWKSKLMEMHG